jgi:hypothetical protein
MKYGAAFFPLLEIAISQSQIKQKIPYGREDSTLFCFNVKQEIERKLKSTYSTLYFMGTTIGTMIGDSGLGVG